jgi:hypothetical protein
MKITVDLSKDEATALLTFLRRVNAKDVGGFDWHSTGNARCCGLRFVTWLNRVGGRKRTSREMVARSNRVGAGIHRLLGIDRTAPRWPTDQSDFAFVDCSRHRCVAYLETEVISAPK